MTVNEIKRMMRKESSYITDGWNGTDSEYLAARMHSIWSSLTPQCKGHVDEATLNRTIKELCDDFRGYGPIQDLLDDPHVTEIMIIGPDKVFVERNGRKEAVPVRFDDAKHLHYTIDRMIAPSGRRVDASMPCADFALSNMMARVNVTLPPIAANGISVTIRKMVQSIGSLADIVAMDTLDFRMANFLVGCLHGRVNILFSGATGTGKTTTINVLSAYIDDSERIVTIEDTLELNLQQGNLVRLLTRPPDPQGKGEVGMRYLFSNALRMRPSRIILGEIRGAESMDYLQALNSGHKGILAILHAATPQDAVARLETMAMYAGLDLPALAIRKQIASGLQLLVQHEQLMDGSRKITYITEVAGLKNDAIVLKDLYRYEIEGIDGDSKVKGRFVALGQPSFLSLLRHHGVEMDDALFAE